jgi:UDP-glucuronate decarboxylase
MQPDDGRVVSNFIVQALSNNDLTIYGRGEQTRSFCFVEDLVDGIIRLMGSPSDVTGPINLGNPEECRIADLAEIIIELTASKSKIAYKPLPVGDPRQRRPDISAARETLGWEPKIGLMEGLKRTIAAFDDLLRIRAPVDLRRLISRPAPSRPRPKDSPKLMRG